MGNLVVQRQALDWVRGNTGGGCLCSVRPAGPSPRRGVFGTEHRAVVDGRGRANEGYGEVHSISYRYTDPTTPSLLFPTISTRGTHNHGEWKACLLLSNSLALRAIINVVLVLQFLPRHQSHHDQTIEILPPLCPLKPANQALSRPPRPPADSPFIQSAQQKTHTVPSKNPVLAPMRSGTSSHLLPI